MQQGQHFSLLILAHWVKRAGLTSLRLPILLKRHQLTLYLITAEDHHRNSVLPDFLVICILQHVLNIFKHDMPVVAGGVGLVIEVVVVMGVVEGIEIGVGTFYLVAREIYNADLILTGPDGNQTTPAQAVAGYLQTQHSQLHHIGI